MLSEFCGFVASLLRIFVLFCAFVCSYVRAFVFVYSVMPLVCKYMCIFPSGTGTCAWF
ncbi:hypothetical protein BDD12DRAFT_870863 [Trichophaea hybrida]|nr:hypothetical protein BDD12DRAFT_870863 [Trichophaea hybrida]